MSSPWWQPANDVERAMSRAVADGDAAEFFRRLIAAELYLPQVPRDGVVLREGAEEWIPVVQQVSGFPAVAVFTSLAGMGSTMVVARYEVTRFAEVRERWAGPDWWVAVNPGLPIDANLPFDAVDRLAAGELVMVEGRLVPADPSRQERQARPYEGAAPDGSAERDGSDGRDGSAERDGIEERAGSDGRGGFDQPGPGYDPGRVLNDPGYASTREEYLEALLDATVSVPLSRVVDDPEDLLAPDFPWLLSPTAAPPTIEVFTSVDGCARSYPDRPSLRVPFLLLMLGWPEDHALTVNPAGPVRMACTAGEVVAIRQRVVAD